MENEAASPPRPQFNQPQLAAAPAATGAPAAAAALGRAARENYD